MRPALTSAEQAGSLLMPLTNFSLKLP